MGKAVNIALMVVTIAVAYEWGRENGAKKMFFTCMDAFYEMKVREEINNESDN